jgi:hypothetical protein
MMEKFETVFKLFRSVFVTVLWIAVAVAWWNETYLMGIFAAMLIAVCELEEINEKIGT